MPPEARIRQSGNSIARGQKDEQYPVSVCLQRLWTLAPYFGQDSTKALRRASQDAITSPSSRRAVSTDFASPARISGAIHGFSASAGGGGSFTASGIDFAQAVSVKALNSRAILVIVIDFLSGGFS